MSDQRTIAGIRYILDGIGFIWQENKTPSVAVPERWTRTAWSSFEQIEQWRGLKKV